VLLGLQPLTTTAVTILSSLRLVTSRLQSYPLRVLPANKKTIAGMARSYKSEYVQRHTSAYMLKAISHSKTGNHRDFLQAQLEAD
jgi:hypothetical protein